jgi:hypothetical protein
MSHNAPSGLQAEYDALRAQAITIAGYFESVFAGDWHTARITLEQRHEDSVTRSVVEGWRETRNDLLEACRGLSGVQLRDLSIRLQAECGVTLDSLQARRLKRLADLRARGRLSTDEQYRLVETRIDELPDDQDAQEELQELLALVDGYDETIQRRLDRQAKRRDGAG